MAENLVVRISFTYRDESYSIPLTVGSLPSRFIDPPRERTEDLLKYILAKRLVIPIEELAVVEFKVVK